MKADRLQKLSFKQLADLRAKVDDLISKKRESERHELLTKLEDEAQKHGFTTSELFGKGIRKGKKAPIKYQNPKNPNETWSGRGLQPRWMVAAGGDPKRFLIK